MEKNIAVIRGDGIGPEIVNEAVKVLNRVSMKEFSRLKLADFDNLNVIRTVRKMYRKLAKQMHPDMHPELAGSEKIQELWNQVSVAYTCNNLKELKELEVLVAAAVAEAGGADVNVVIPDLEEKIAALEKEIEDIMTNDPWRYQFLLNDPKAVEEKKRALREELKTYQEHSAQLDKMLAEILPEGTVIIWD